ncbi:probable 2-oxoglutarate-dependent dioxygenase AOP1 [Abrus precatorius]|uniref:Probable 2-oxoglutarate-dependent dioxygenase AOP1 n=1 Tax=Abrus precatorius TaxID=3816 RepID=A0A8B8MJD1_ABRPR|nr:probable 2-oxoglutarate-dependent dioxygenase AOP1 [Abrus precatorius]
MWPGGNDYFCERVNAYAKVMKELDQTVKKMVFDSYGLDKKKCESFLESMNYVFRGHKYRIPEMDESNVGLTPHTDTTFLTILHQKVAGLEIKLKDGKWFRLDASPLFCVLAGDAFMVWSNERIRSCEHRIILSESNVTRYSLGLLSYSNTMVQTSEDLIDEEHPLRYKPFNHYEYIGFVSTEEGAKCKNRIKAYCGV